MTLHLKLDSVRVKANDYGYDITGTVYTDRSFQTVKPLTGQTITLKIFKRFHAHDLFAKTGTIVTAADGTWKYTVGQGEMVPDGFYKFELELDDGSIVESAIDERDFVVEESPV